MHRGTEMKTKFKAVAAEPAGQVELHGYAAELESLAESVDPAKVKSILRDHGGCDRIADIPPEKEPAVIAALFEATLESRPARKSTDERERARAKADAKYARRFRKALFERNARGGDRRAKGHTW